MILSGGRLVDYPAEEGGKRLPKLIFNQDSNCELRPYRSVSLSLARDVAQACSLFIFRFFKMVGVGVGVTLAMSR
jgi:hypothetical protein